MQTKFIISHNGQEMGPLTEAQIKTILLDNQIFPTDYFYDEEKKDWLLVSDRFNIFPQTEVKSAPAPVEVKTSPLHAEVRVTPPPAGKKTWPAQTTEVKTSSVHTEIKTSPVQTVVKPHPVHHVPKEEKKSHSEMPRIDDMAKIRVVASEAVNFATQTPVQAVAKTDSKPEPKLESKSEPKSELKSTSAHSGKIHLNGGVGTLSIQQVKAGPISLVWKSGSGLDMPSELNLTIQAAPAAQIKMDVPNQSRAGDELTVTFTAFDFYENVAVDFKGEFEVSLTGKQKEIQKAKFEKGTASVQFKPTVAEMVSIQLKKSGSSDVKFPSDVQLAIHPNVAVKLIAEGPHEARAGEKIDLKVTALDVYGNIVTDFKGEVELEVEALAKKVS